MCIICPYFVVFFKKEIPNSTLLSLLHGKINHHHSIFNALYFFYSACKTVIGATVMQHIFELFGPSDEQL
jgi:hypothetical protein